MARGGGGFRGRGGGPKGPAGLDWEIKYEGISWKPEKQWPNMKRPVTAPIRPHERDAVDRFRKFRDQIRESPLYTVRGRPKVHKPDCAFDKRSDNTPYIPFDYARTYSQKYYRPKRTMPKLDTRPYVLEFFPEELHYLLGVKKSDDKSSGDAAEGKKLDIAREDWQSRLEAMNDEEEPVDGVDDDLLEEDEEGSNKDAEEEDEELENLEEDESEDDDYNAERYFDGGEDDDGDDGAGGDDGGGGGGYDDYD